MTILTGWSVTKPVLVSDLSSRFEDLVSSGQVTGMISSTQFLVPSTRPGPVEPERLIGRRNRWCTVFWCLATLYPMRYATRLTIKMRDKRILSATEAALSRPLPYSTNIFFRFPRIVLPLCLDHIHHFHVVPSFRLSLCGPWSVRLLPGMNLLVRLELI